MRGKILFVMGLGAGYILGTRAGRKRYEQIKSAARSVWNTRPVQDSVDAAKDFALTHVGDAGELAADALKKLVRLATNNAKRAERVAEDFVGDTAEFVSEVAEATSQKSQGKTQPKTQPKTSTKPKAKNPSRSATATRAASAEKK